MHSPRHSEWRHIISYRHGTGILFNTETINAAERGLLPEGVGGSGAAYNKGITKELLKAVSLLKCNTSASADPFPPPTQYEVNNGDGTCSTVSCNQYGCSVIDVHLCPREVGGG